MPSERTFEPEMRVIILRIAADAPNGTITTTEAKERAGKYFSPTEGDLEPNPLRAGEPMYYQIIGNATGSHGGSGKSLYSEGYALRTDDGLTITPEGRAYLREKGH
jgi:hypothetical protein